MYEMLTHKLYKQIIITWQCAMASGVHKVTYVIKNRPIGLWHNIRFQSFFIKQVVNGFYSNCGQKFTFWI